MRGGTDEFGVEASPGRLAESGCVAASECVAASLDLSTHTGVCWTFLSSHLTGLAVHPLDASLI